MEIKNLDKLGNSLINQSSGKSLVRLRNYQDYLRDILDDGISSLHGLERLVVFWLESFIADLFYNFDDSISLTEDNKKIFAEAIKDVLKQLGKSLVQINESFCDLDYAKCCKNMAMVVSVYLDRINRLNKVL